MWFSFFSFLCMAVAAVAAVAQGQSTSTSTSNTTSHPISFPKLALDFGNVAGFYHGVASGSPLPDGMILWTRYTPLSANEVVTVEYRIAEVSDNSNVTGLLDPRRNPQLRVGITEARPAQDWTVKLDVRELKPKTQYVYAFVTTTAVSPVGKFKTAPAANDPVTEGLRVAVFSCSNFRTGYFHAYNVGARIEGLDFWIHLGDYIYERPPEPNATRDRQLQTEPSHDLITLQDYRLRHATYRTDPALQKLHATAALVATWDDHEFADNAYKKGARKHNPLTQGPWQDRVQAAVQAYLEWIPIRPSMDGRGMGPFVKQVSITQTLEFGQLATLVSFDTRIGHRSSAPADGNDAQTEFPTRSHVNVTKYQEEPLRSRFDAIAKDILKRQYDSSVQIAGRRLVRYLDNAFLQSKRQGKPWQIFAAPVMMGYNVWPSWPELAEFAPPEWRREFEEHLDHHVLTKDGNRFRGSVPLAHYQICASFDSWCGAAVERAQILKNIQKHANTGVVLGGDSHSSWAFKLYQGGGTQGKQVAINVGCPGVSASGFSKELDGFMAPLIRDLVDTNRTTSEELWQVFHDSWVQNNRGLRFVNLYQRGFYAMKLLPQEAYFEFFHLPDGLVKMDYETVAQQYGPVPPHECTASLKSTAYRRGSLRRLRPKLDTPCRQFNIQQGEDELLAEGRISVFPREEEEERGTTTGAATIKTTPIAKGVFEHHYR